MNLFFFMESNIAAAFEFLCRFSLCEFDATFFFLLQVEVETLVNFKFL
jgi:hypothetical protein